jgi:hypothetical protein
MHETTRKPTAQSMAKSTVKPTAGPSNAWTSFGTPVLVVALLGILALAAWYASRAWTSVVGPPMPTTGYVAMTLGVVFSLLVGFALMALLFYSSRHGYDDRASERQPESDDVRD